MPKKIAIAFAALALVLVSAVGYAAATKPDTFRIERAQTIKAAPEKITPQIEDFHKWASWSPYEKLDPGMQRSFSGAPSGKGAVYEWKGNGNAGSGRMEIVEATAAKITIKLDFTAPMKASNVAEFTLEPKGDSTTVTWSMTGANSVPGKTMQLFFDMDKLLGKDFESGLANLKTVAEK